MAKGARASTKKANNAKLKSRVFGPIETARTERLSAKLQELISQPKPKKEDVMMNADDDAPDNIDANIQTKISEDMEVDQDASAKPKLSKNRIEKKRAKSSRKASIVFPKYKNGGKGASRSRGKK